MPDLSQALEQLKQRRRYVHRLVIGSTEGAHVEVDGRRLLSFCSTDYLGLAHDARVADIVARAAARYGIGSAAAPLAAGHRHVHERLERALADFLGYERTLLFPSVTAACEAALSTLVGKGDALFCDEYCQTSFLQAARATGARVEIYSHGDMTHLEFAMVSSTASRKLILSHAVFPYQGDLAPLARMMELSQRHDAWLLLDDSHGFGVLGAGGRGSLVKLGLGTKNVLLCVSLAEAAGASGAFLCGPAPAMDWVMQNCLTYQESPAPSPALSAGLIVALKLLEEEEEKRAHLRQLCEQMRAGLQASGLMMLPAEAALHVVMLGDAVATMRVAEDLLQRNTWVQIAPSSSQGGSRLRIALTAQHSMQDVQTLLSNLAEVRASPY